MDCAINDNLFAFPEPDAMTVNDDYAQPDIGYEQLELARSIQLALDPSTYILDSRNAVDPIMRGQSASAEEDLLLKKSIDPIASGGNGHPGKGGNPSTSVLIANMSTTPRPSAMSSCHINST